MTAVVDRMRATEREREKIAAEFPDEFRAGVRAAMLGGDYPCAFNSWALDRRNSWWSGWNFGASEKERMARESEAKNGRS